MMALEHRWYVHNKMHVYVQSVYDKVHVYVQYQYDKVHVNVHTAENKLENMNVIQVDE